MKLILIINKPIKHVNSHNYLEVTIDDTLSWGVILITLKKPNGLVGALGARVNTFQILADI